MSYLVLARKWRPQRFKDVVGQEHITRILEAALSARRIPHAYLFSGPRGVGKTTVARLLARALNCEKGPTPEPCGECSSCREILQGSALDVLEIDGASNTGVDHVRSLQENTHLAPARGGYRVYIIDEVHMLSTPAFNALLKTLEEPPEHVVFIFATTEPGEILPTIASRCQRFSFHLIGQKEMLGILEKVCREEQFSLPREALVRISQASGGSLRDALGLLDQIFSHGKKEATLEEVAGLLGLLPAEFLFSFVETVLSRDAVGLYALVSRILNEGHDVSTLLTGVLEQFRRLMLAKVTPSALSPLFLAEEETRKLASLAEKISLEECLRAIRLVSQARLSLAHGSEPQLALEICLAELVSPHVNLADLVERVSKLMVVKPPLDRTAAESASARSSLSPEPVRAVPVPINPSSQMAQDLWQRVVECFREKDGHFAECLSEGRLVSKEGALFKVGFPESFEMLGYVERQKEQIEKALRDISHAGEVSLLLIKGGKIKETPGAALATAPSKEVKEVKPPAPEPALKARQPAALDKEKILQIEPVAKRIVDLFDGEIEEVVPPSP